ncbi:hypothetical protein ACOMCU_24645 [Lysinibacillus sp. UGB7]|uniref:hypothetical protein n=1 Tax=Lysinibacillus sp. UGB7 TaxID=3411039 RepID=UPI003B80C7E8
MVELDFTRIRSFDGSKDGGFEELVCQLAHLNKPEIGKRFVRKDGAGGDAGVECYWLLEDGSEHAWQAKYFTERLESSEWSQIDYSVKTALNKHPNLTKYYISVPRDFNDSRKLGRGKKPVTSSLDIWNQYVKAWTEIANSKGMNVEFIYWGRHELSMMLQTDDSKYAGRAFYWFNELLLNMEKFKHTTNKSKEGIGERFSEEYHVELPISKKLDGLGVTAYWKSEIDKQKASIDSLLKQINRLDNFKKDLIVKEKLWQNFLAKCISFNEIYLEALKGKYSSNQFEIARLRIEDIDELAVKFNSFCWDKVESKEEGWKEVRDKFRKILDEINTIKSFVFSIQVKSFELKSAIILGEAGIGKSHLLCDIALKRLEENLPTIFLLGQKYSGGNPLNFLAEELDLKQVPFKKMLGALDAAGESRNTRTLIIIDALNEGNYRFEWIDHLASFIAELKEYPHISLLLSCRETYKDGILPNTIEKNIVRIQHTGFRGYEHRAAMKYLAKQGIDKPSMPILSPEFSNPLFLKTCCKAIKSKKLTSFPKGLEGQTAIFNFYLNSIDEIIRIKKDYFKGQKIILNVTNSIVEKLYPHNMFGIDISVAYEIIQNIDPNPHSGEPLIKLLISEGLLALDMISDKDGDLTEVVRFTYERFSDYFIAENIVNLLNPEELELEFENNGNLEAILNEPYMFSGVIEALGITFPEKFKIEFIDFIPESSPYYRSIFNTSFVNIFLLRSKDSITDRTIELLNQIPSYGYFKDSLDKILALSTEPDHPLNAEFLHRNLKKLDMEKRDCFWSAHLAVSDYEEDEEQPESITRTLINWALFTDLSDIEDERIRLLSYTLLWMTTTSNRKVRDQATKSLVRILSSRPSIVKELLFEFNDVDDLYLKERLYAATYGVVCNINNLGEIKEIAERVYYLQFADNMPDPHLLLRDYARGVLEYALYKNVINEEMKVNFRPPYKSEWPIENPTASEIEDKEYSSIKSSVIGFIGDFGKYTMSCVHSWSPTEITESTLENSYELHLKFAEKIPAELRSEYLNEINERIQNYSTERTITIIDLPDEPNVFDDFKNECDRVNLVEEGEEKERREFSFVTRNIDKPSDNWQTLKEKVSNLLNESDKETFRWITGLGVTNRPANFSRKWAQRWVCKRAFELGWKKELFEDFERMYCGSYDREPRNIERIGKKYQWIAFYELLAKMSDNLYWINKYDDASEYEGPWQVGKRDIDPTIWLRSTNDSGWDEFGDVWWSPCIPTFSANNSEEWVFDEKTIPNFGDLLKVTNPNDNKQLYKLRGFRKWTKKTEDNKSKEEIWYRVNSCIVKKENVINMIEKMQNNPLFDPSVFSPQSSSSQGFLKEYPWHPYYTFLKEWCNDDGNQTLNIEHLVPTNEYEQRTGEDDKSIDQNISIYLPNPLLIRELELISSSENFSEWMNSKNEIVFLDPSEKEKGPSAAMINAAILDEWLEKNNLQIIWFIGGEKQIFNSNGEVTKWFEFSNIITIEDKNIEEKKFFNEGIRYN